MAYRFQVTFPDEWEGLAFLRWDLDSIHERQGRRSHLHPGIDRGLRLPAPVMQPVEFLDLFVHGLARDGR